MRKAEAMSPSRRSDCDPINIHRISVGILESEKSNGCVGLSLSCREHNVGQNSNALGALK